MEKPPQEKLLLSYWTPNSHRIIVYTISHSARMINICTGRIPHRLKNTHKLVYGEKSYASTWFLILYIGYFHHQKDGAFTIYSTQSQALADLYIGISKDSNTMTFSNPVTCNIYTTRVYDLNPGRQTNDHFVLGNVIIILLKPVGISHEWIKTNFKYQEPVLTLYFLMSQKRTLWSPSCTYRGKW